MAKKTMVTVDFHQKLVRNLEKYLVRETGFKLTGRGYDLILFIPIDSTSFDSKSTLIISAKLLDDKRERTIIQHILTSFKSILNFAEFSLISSLQVVNSNSTLVKNMDFAFPFQRREDIEYEVNTTIGGIPLYGARLVRSSVLANLITGKRCRIKLISGNILSGKVMGISEDYQVAIEIESTAEIIPPTTSCQFEDIVSVHTFVGENW